LNVIPKLYLEAKAVLKENKMMISFTVRRLGYIFIFFMLVTGCAATTAPTRFYSLNSAAGPEKQGRAASIDNDIAIGVGPIEIPDYLDRPHIVTRVGKNELKISDFEKWAGSFKNDVTRVLAENLSILLSTDRVYTHPVKSHIPLEYQVTVSIIRFDGEPGGNILFKAHWYVLEGNGNKGLLIETSSLIEKVDGRDYHALIAAKSRVLSAFSRAVADAIRSVSK
jgi:uncharacterized lipoprotein YmbA